MIGEDHSMKVIFRFDKKDRPHLQDRGEFKPYLYGGGVIYKRERLINGIVDEDIGIEYTKGLGEGRVFDRELREYRKARPTELLVYSSSLKEAFNEGEEPDLEQLENVARRWENFGLIYGFNMLDKFPQLSSFKEIKERWQC